LTEGTWVKTDEGGIMCRQVSIKTRQLVILAVLGLLAVACSSTKEVPRMGKDELKGMLGSKDLILIDVRAGKDWDESGMKIKGSVREDSDNFDSWFAKYPKEKTLVLYCA
jgi:hypothetical protein